MARIGAYLYAAGATLALIWLTLPHTVVSEDLWLVATAAVTYAAAWGLWRFGARLRPRQWELVVAFGILTISLAVDFSGRASTPFVLFYLWSNVYAWYFFPRRRAALQLLLTGLAYACVLLMRGPTPSSAGSPRSATSWCRWSRRRPRW